MAAFYVIAVVQDLLFATKIRSTARSLGVELQTVTNAAALAGALDRLPAGLVIVDLALPETEALAAVEVGADHPCDAHVLAFVSHVDERLAQKAAEAGADEVMPRSRFSHQLPEILRPFASSEAPMP